ncbi:MAG: pyridoxal phosphate-dependent aminotransferase [Thiolinea sp.]
MDIVSSLASRAQLLEASGIREIAELGMKQGDVLPLWFGEGSWPTNTRIVEAAVASLRAGNHQYQPNNGSVKLRQAICSYSNNLLDSQLTPEQITVTPSGMQGLMLTAELLVSPGDKVVVLEPGWPNITGCFRATGADVESLSLGVHNGRWQLDLQALLAVLTPDTQAVVINSPNNPTGWTMSAPEQQQLLDHCREHNIWIVADDVYTRLYRHGKHAPSFLTLAKPDDKVISVNSFSKCWSMTGWRLGWITAPAECEAKLGQLTEFNTSCTPGFVQDAGIVALQEGEEEVADLQSKIKTGYEITAQELGRFSRVEFIEPDGAFYSFFRVAGLRDSMTAAKTIMQETRVGLAPGIAFGKEGEGYLRLCYAQPVDVLERAFRQLSPFLS